MILPLLITIYSTIYSNPNIIISNILNNYSSIQFTSHLHKQYNISKDHIIYFGDKYDLPITTVRMNQLLYNNDNNLLLCNNTPYYKLISDKYKLNCKIEYKISEILNALIKSNESYEILFDDSFWLQDESIYRLLYNKNIKRILQLDLNQNNLYSPKFTEETIYYWKNNDIII